MDGSYMMASKNARLDAVVALGTLLNGKCRLGSSRT